MSRSELPKQLTPFIDGSARTVEQCHERPPKEVAEKYAETGPERFLWNSGMFVWRAETLLTCIRRYETPVREALMAIAEAWQTPARDEVLDRVFPTLKKVSVDYAVIEPASRDSSVRVAAVPMQLSWLDVGSWPSFADSRPQDHGGNALAAATHVLAQTRNCLVASNDRDHLIATVGCNDLIVVHTDRATLVCHADSAESTQAVQKIVHERFDGRYTWSWRPSWLPFPRKIRGIEQ